VDNETRVPMGVQASVQLGAFLASLGVQLVVWANLLQDTDPNESYQPFVEAADDMLIHSEVMLAVLASLSKTAAHKEVELPPHIGALSVPNPLKEMNEREARDKISASRSAGGVDDKHTPDIPF